MGKKKGGRMDINDIKKEFLGEVWDSAQARGRCWNTVGSKSPLRGSHITLINHDEAVSLYEQEGEFFLLEFKKSSRTELGERIREILGQKSVTLK